MMGPVLASIRTASVQYCMGCPKHFTATPSNVFTHELLKITHANSPVVFLLTGSPERKKATGLGQILRNVTLRKPPEKRYFYKQFEGEYIHCE